MSDTLSGAWRSKRCPAKPTKKEELVDLGRVFGVSFGGSDESDDSDAEFAPENVSMDSEDSHECEEDSSVGSVSSSTSSEDLTCPKGDGVEEEEEDGGEEEEENEAAGGDEVLVPAQDEYNPLIVRRSQRAIKPTKDVDLYLLGSQYGIDVEGSELDSSDQEFAPGSDVCSSGSAGAAEDDSMDEHSVGPEAPTDDEVVGVVNEGKLDMVCSPHKIHLLCCVCLEDSCVAGELVECDGCGIAVHEGCYGVPEEEEADDNRSDLSSFTTTPWFCEPCKGGVQASLCSCELCPTTGGLFKQTIHGRWVHMVCVLYTPSIEYVEPGQLCGITLDQLPASRWGSKVCQLCEDVKLSRTGICIGCDAGLCRSSFHVTCAQRHGLLCEVDSEDEAKDELCDPFFAHCKAHADKDLTKRKRRDYLTMMKRSNGFQCEVMEERTRHYLEEARKEYGEYFAKMRTYFQPEKGFRGEERWLHSAPSAMRRLTLKAELLGHVSKETVSETRWRVVPGLTIEFVKYFRERQMLMQSLEQQQQVLHHTHAHLHQEQTHVRGDLNTLSQTLNNLSGVGKERQDLITSLYLHLTDMGLKEQGLPMPDELEEMESSNVLGGGGQCAVCEGREEGHLMMVCDTCQHHYHIHCLDPPLAKIPKKSSKWGWQCHSCCYASGDELRPISPNFDEPSSRSGRRIKVPKVLSYPDQKVKPSKKKTKLAK